MTALSNVASIFAESDRTVTPFNYRATQDALNDLKDRLKHTRWPDRETMNDWSQGVPLSHLRALVDYWRTGYDWRRCETALNRFSQYRTRMLHFAQRSGYKNFTARKPAFLGPLLFSADV